MWRIKQGQETIAEEEERVGKFRCKLSALHRRLLFFSFVIAVPFIISIISWLRSAAT